MASIFGKYWTVQGVSRDVTTRRRHGGKSLQLQRLRTDKAINATTTLKIYVPITYSCINDSFQYPYRHSISPACTSAPSTNVPTPTGRHHTPGGCLPEKFGHEENQTKEVLLAETESQTGTHTHQGICVSGEPDQKQHSRKDRKRSCCHLNQ